ncbi:dihydrolipoyllysine-residue acetyltransferase component of pyruvate dehydrogenase complex [Spirochaetota bacterium]|nr:dihydrolipoyllysine-residue acetyltransferase component of pyruvate dehydrogenase complex [Spirochaetota bacterium]
MDFTVELTDIGDGISSGLVTAILPKTGDSVSEGDTLIEIETDKAVIPFPSPKEGTLGQVFIKEGTEIKVGDKIATLKTQATATPSATEPPSVTTKEHKLEPPPSPPPAQEPPTTLAEPPTAIHSKSTPDQQPVVNNAVAKHNQENLVNTEHATEQAIIAASPGTRKLARELDITLSVVGGSGRNGRITMDDLKSYVKQSLHSQSTTALLPTGTTSPMQAAAPLPDFSEFGAVEIKPVSSLRQTIARNMQTSWSTIPHVHHNSKFDISVITAWQKSYHEDFKALGSTLSVTPILIKALAHILKEFPEFNASFDTIKNEIHYKKYYHIGVAVDTPSGLIVPVIKDVDTLSVFAIGKTLRDIAKKTRDRKIGLADLKGACLTLSNLGGIGGEHFTPIINPPEVAIVGVARTINEVVLSPTTKQPLTIPMLPVTLGYDHRVIDGAVAARFLVRLKSLIEAPQTLLMGLELPSK